MNMPSLTAYPGFGDIAAIEVKELVGALASVKGDSVNFKAGDSQLGKLCYLSQSAASVVFSGKRSFVCGREYSVFASSDGLPGNLAYLLLRASGYTGRQLLFDPFARSGSIAIEAALFSSGFPVNYYRKSDIQGSFAGASLRFFQDARGQSESAARKRLAGKKPEIVCSSESMQFVRAAEKNAKIAGVNKMIRFSRLDIAWLDAKVGDRSVDLVVSYPPQFRGGTFSASENSRLLRMYSSFFEHASFFMKKKGVIALLLGRKTKAAILPLSAKFRASVLRSVQLGPEQLELVRFSLQ